VKIEHGPGLARQRSGVRRQIAGNQGRDQGQRAEHRQHLAETGHRGPASEQATRLDRAARDEKRDREVDADRVDQVEHPGKDNPAGS